MKYSAVVGSRIGSAGRCSASDWAIAPSRTVRPRRPPGSTAQSNGFAEEFCANQDALTNSPNSPQIPEDECNFDAALEEFIGPETVADGLGPIFNASGCGECHIGNPGNADDGTPLLGATSQVTEKRAGFFNGTVFTPHPGGSLIQDRALNPSDQELVFPSATNVIALRSTLSVLGDGFVEAIANDTLQNIANNQPSSKRGQLISVPVLEKPGTTRVGRFGHKDQQASLVSFSADAYVNEMGITSPLQPDENTSNGRTVPDPVPGLDDEGVDVELFALFMRSIKAPPRDPVRSAHPDAVAGSNIFNAIGCATCHTRTIVTAAPGTQINGGAMRVSHALGNKIIHPFSDFLLHDVGTGDGIVQNGPALDAEQAPDAAPLGPAGARPVHARQPDLRPGERDRASRQPGRGRAERVQRAQYQRQEQADRVPAVALEVNRL